MEYILENPNSGTGRVEQVGDGLWKLSLSFGEAILPEPVKLHFRLPCVDVYSVWYTHFHRRKNLAPGYDKIHAPARFASGAPVMAFVSLSGQNRMALALSEVRRETEITFGILEETGEVDGVISFFPHKTERMAEYTCLIREDVRDIRYEDALRGVERWWESLGDAGAAVPLTARLPMYSTWYNFHQNFKEEDLIAECTIAKRMGMDTILLDDGWQTGDNNRGYAYCGDWEVYPGKIPDMRRFTDRIHDLGMKVIVWYSVPFVGKYSKSYETYRGFYLNDDGRTAICLDPRYPHIRAHLVELYAKAVEDFNLDGLKLDFIDSFCMTESALVPDARRDTESLEEALDLLSAEYMDSFKGDDPNRTFSLTDYQSVTARVLGATMELPVDESGQIGSPWDTLETWEMSDKTWLVDITAEFRGEGTADCGIGTLDPEQWYDLPIGGFPPRCFLMYNDGANWYLWSRNAYRCLPGVLK